MAARETQTENTKVVHCTRGTHDVYIGRPSKWGNPFVIGKDGTREQVIRKYRNWTAFTYRLEESSVRPHLPPVSLTWRHDVRFKRSVAFCARHLSRSRLRAFSRREASPTPATNRCHVRC